MPWVLSVCDLWWVGDRTHCSRRSRAAEAVRESWASCSSTKAVSSDVLLGRAAGARQGRGGDTVAGP